MIGQCLTASDHFCKNQVFVHIFPLKPMVTMDSTVVAPRPVLAGISVPFSVLTSQKVTQEQQTISISGM